MAITISNKAAYIFGGIFVAILIAGVAIAYGGNNPAVMGHSAGEVAITLPNGTVTTLQSAVTNNYLGGGAVTFTGGQGPFCILANSCPAGWTNRGLAGIIMPIVNYCPFIQGTGGPNDDWTWCHPYLCCK